MPLNPGTNFLAYNVFQTDKNRHKIKMPGISKSTSIPFKVLYLRYYRFIRVRIENGRNYKNGFVKNLSHKILKGNAHIPNSEWLLIS